MTKPKGIKKAVATLQVRKNRGRKGCTYYAYWVNPITRKRERASLGVSEKRLAEKEVRNRYQPHCDRLNAVAMGELPASALQGAALLVDLVRDYHTYLIEVKKAKSIYAANAKRERLLYMFDAIQTETLADLEETGFKAKFKKLVRDLPAMKSIKSAAVDSHITDAKSFGTWLIEEELLSVNPFAFQKKTFKRGDESFVRSALSTVEINLILSSVVPHYEATSKFTPGTKRFEKGLKQAQRRQRMLVVYSEASFRHAELKNIEWRDIDKDSQRVVIRGEINKSGKDQYIQLTPVAFQALEEERKVQIQKQQSFVQPTDRIFPCEFRITQTLKKLAFSLGLCNEKGIRPDNTTIDLHGLGRTSFATNRMDEGTAVPHVATMMRHASPTTTLKHYNKLDLDDAVRADPRFKSAETVSSPGVTRKSS